MPIYCLFARGTVRIVRVDDLTALAHSQPLKPSGKSDAEVWRVCMSASWGADLELLDSVATVCEKP